MFSDNECLHLIIQSINSKLLPIVWKKFIAKYPQIKLSCKSYVGLYLLSSYCIPVGNYETPVPKELESELRTIYACELSKTIEKIFNIK